MDDVLQARFNSLVIMADWAHDGLYIGRWEVSEGYY